MFSSSPLHNCHIDGGKPTISKEQKTNTRFPEKPLKIKKTRNVKPVISTYLVTELYHRGRRHDPLGVRPPETT